MLQTQKRPPQKGERSNGITRIEMVKRGGYLDECLKKGFLRLIQGEPDAFPMLVSEEELASSIAGESFLKFTMSPIKRHAISIGDLAASGVPGSSAADLLCCMNRDRGLLVSCWRGHTRIGGFPDWLRVVLSLSSRCRLVV